MTQQPQEDFDRNVEDAQAWMKVVQEQLQVNDNTQGPRAALEARLRETEVGSDPALLVLWDWLPPSTLAEGLSGCSHPDLCLDGLVILLKYAF